VATEWRIAGFSAVANTENVWGEGIHAKVLGGSFSLQMPQ
jgi:hypothetical protein